MRKLFFLLLLAIPACAAVIAPPVVKPVSPPLSMVVEHFADSTVATVQCGQAAWRAAQRVTACDWNIVKDNTTAITVPQAFVARIVLTGAEGDTATYAVTAKGWKPGLTPAQLAARPAASTVVGLKIGIKTPTAPDTLIVTVTDA